jgi:quinol monooxygenase YgiN
MDKDMTVFTAYDVAHAYVIKCAIENAGIPVRVENEFLQSVLSLSPLDTSTATKVCVPQSFTEQAEAIVNDIIPACSEITDASDAVDAAQAMVLMHVKYDEFVEDEVQELGEEAIRLCKQYEGFVSVRQYRVKDADEFYILMHWENEHAYHACKQSPAWLMLMPQGNALQDDGDVVLNIKILTAQ